MNEGFFDTGSYVLCNYSQTLKYYKINYRYLYKHAIKIFVHTLNIDIYNDFVINAFI
jgi:hypothetical protein